MATNVNLTRQLERFARECVKSGRYNNVSEVMRSALRQLQETEERRRRFMDMLTATAAEADRKGVHDAVTVGAEMETIVRKKRR